MTKQDLKVKPDTKVFVDSKTNARTIALTFRLPDNSSAVLMVCRLKDADWIPVEVIEKIVVHYKNKK